MQMSHYIMLAGSLSNTSVDFLDKLPLLRGRVDVGPEGFTSGQPLWTSKSWTSGNPPFFANVRAVLPSESVIFTLALF